MTTVTLRSDQELGIVQLIVLALDEFQSSPEPGWTKARRLLDNRLDQIRESITKDKVISCIRLCAGGPILPCWKSR